MKKQGFSFENKPDWLYIATVMGFAVLMNQPFYQGGRLLSFWLPHHSLSLPLDEQIPLLPWTLSVYVGCFAFWLWQYYLCARQERQESDRFFAAGILAKCLCLLIFVLFPTRMERPEPTGDGFWTRMLRLMYWIDSPDNLFPSLHCILAWLCWIGVRGKKRFPFAYRAFSLIAALLVFTSTLTIKQHVILDVAGGVAVAELGYWLAGKERLRGIYSRLIDAIMAWLRTFWEKRAHKKNSLSGAEQKTDKKRSNP